MPRAECTYKFEAPERKVPKRFRIRITRKGVINHRYYSDEIEARLAYVHYVSGSMLSEDPSAYAFAVLNEEGKYIDEAIGQSRGRR